MANWRNKMTAGQKKILKRSNDQMIAGVCAGIAEYLGWLSPNRVRIAYVLISVVSVMFPGIVVYIILWLLLPPPDYNPGS